MALRLAGEPFTTIQGADNQGWVREVVAQDALPGLKIDQKSTGRIFDFQDSGVSRLFMQDGGSLLLGSAASPPSTPKSLLHLWAGNSTLAAPVASTNITIESNTTNYLSLISAAAAIQGIVFGIPGDDDFTFIRARNDAANDPLEIQVAGTISLKYFAGDFSFQQATSIKTVAGDLTLDPAGKIALGTGKLITGWSTQTTVGAAGAASALPANPTGYVKVDVGGSTYVIPYYAAA